MKVRLRLPGGEWVDRIPAWIKWAVVPQGEMGAKYVGVHWAPAEAHAWVHPRPPRPATLRIYEAHVGMSSEERAVASYTYFKGGGDGVEGQCLMMFVCMCAWEDGGRWGSAFGRGRV